MSWGLAHDQAPEGTRRAASSDSSSSPMSGWWLTERPQRHPRTPGCSPPTGCSTHRKGPKIQSWHRVWGKMSWSLKEVEKLKKTAQNLPHGNLSCWSNFRVMGFLVPHYVLITKPHKLSGLFRPQLPYRSLVNISVSKQPYDFSKMLSICCKHLCNKWHPAVELTPKISLHF